jgi:hypothetical protein
MSYRPTPLDTSKITLSPELLALSEDLARNAHDVWGQQRISEGWKPGPRRDDEQKHHPDLVPYEQLPESEKQYDRNAALQTLRAIVSLGWSIHPPAQVPRRSAGKGEDSRDLGAWRKRLETGASDRSRSATFDMDDGPEIAAPELASFPTLRSALGLLDEVVQSAWKESDADAINQQRRHSRAAKTAIFAGTLSIILAIVEPLLPEGWIAVWANRFSGLVVLIVAVAVTAGLVMGFGEWWLTRRQTAERLRLIKFAALGWPELWCDFEAWRGKVRDAVTALKGLSKEAAEFWARTATPEPTVEWPFECRIPEPELSAFVSYYQAKRQRFQKAYFESQAAMHRKSTRWMRPALPIVLFIVSVAAALIHVIMVGRGAEDHKALANTLLGIAGGLPVVGFGIRAWSNALELPRRATLFEAKAMTLDDFVKRLDSIGADDRRVLVHVAICESVLEEEHREWCRLQLGAEWFL